MLHLLSTPSCQAHGCNMWPILESCRASIQVLRISPLLPYLQPVTINQGQSSSPSSSSGSTSTTTHTNHSQVHQHQEAVPALPWWRCVWQLPHTCGGSPLWRTTALPARCTAPLTARHSFGPAGSGASWDTRPAGSRACRGLWGPRTQTGPDSELGLVLVRLLARARLDPGRPM